MEKAVYIPSSAPFPEKLPACDRVYFGNEFCDELVAGPGAVARAAAMAKEKGAAFTLVTGYAGEFRVKDYCRLLETAASVSPGCEAVVNDWGLLAPCVANGLVPVLGRLLVRQKRDPRIPSFIESLAGPLRARLRSAYLSGYFLDFLRGKGIRRVEMDNLLQGIDDSELKGAGISCSVYLPYVYVTVTRMCVFRGGNKQYHLSSCGRRCLKGSTSLENREMKELLIMRGNAFFVRNDRVPQLAPDSPIDRIVHETDIPA